jgi:hypothetical protein
MLGAADAQGSPPCGNAEKMIAKLSELYGETQQTGGFVGKPPGHILVVFANTAEEPRTWTVLEMAPDGTACIISAGEGWMDMATGDPAQKGDPL